MKKFILWTQEEKNALKRMHELGRHYSEIAEVVGKTHASVQTQITNLKRKKRQQDAQLLRETA
jgi:phage regulator Rha-like protein